MVTFNINLFSIKKSYFWFSGLSNVTMATNLSACTLDFLKLSFHMFPYNEILKFSKVKSELDHHFQGQWLDVERCYPIFPHLVISVS